VILNILAAKGPLKYFQASFQDFERVNWTQVN